MFNLEPQDWIYIGSFCVAAVLLVVLLKISYSTKSHVPLPPNKPGFCWLPKYLVTIELPGADLEAELASALAPLGFKPVGGDGRLEFSRGSEIGDISIKIAKVLVRARPPLANPLQLEVEYGVALGTAFDTGDLWKFCRELSDKVERRRHQ